MTYCEGVYNKIYNKLNPIVEWCANNGISPNMITTIRLILSSVAVYAIYHRMNVMIPLVLITVSYFLDYVDGKLARDHGGASKIGAYYDGAVDGALLLLIFFAPLYVLKKNNVYSNKYILLFVPYLTFIASNKICLDTLAFMLIMICSLYITVD